MATDTYSTEELVKRLRTLAKASDHGTACDLNESANRLQNHDEIFRRMAQALPGAHKAEDFHEVAKSTLALITTKSDFSLGTLFVMLLNQVRSMKSRREFSLMFTKLQEAEMWYRQGLHEIEMEQQTNKMLSTESKLDPTKPWVHYVPVDKAWCHEETFQALDKYKKSVKDQLASVRSFNNDLFLPEVDGKSARIIVIG